ncbi:uncharacterized protein LOC142616347 [Castanea sativa]|uniref:uncharacterized protein LOC142616347 n=1 Tax=Castanea sativa TaxID=21020 RepID=UPI003F64F3A3
MTEAGPPSDWVSKLMRKFCKMVGFPIVRHEAQCLALFRILEQECLKVKDEEVSKRPSISGTRGLRELKGLISYVNYEGASARSKCRDALTDSGAASVYGPNDNGQRPNLWGELSQVRARWPVAWCLVGDFNIIRYPSERLGCETFSPAMLAFSDFIENNYLVDLPLEGASFTWFRDSGLPSMSRIDRALVSLDWEEHFEYVSQRVLPRVLSDHCPLLLEAGGVWRGRSAFKFENMWLKDEGFVDRVKQWWDGYSFEGSPSFILAQKLKALKADLKKWNREEFGDLAFRKKNKLTELMGLDVREELVGLSNEDQSRRIQLKGDIEHLASLEETSWRQKSRALFVKEGDNNTRFFHRLANSHRNAN